MPLLALALFSLSGCADNHKANQLITEYIKRNTNDPTSYEAVSFSRPRKLTYGDVSAGEQGGNPLDGTLIEHTFRAKNKMGALSLETEGFVVDSIDKSVQPLTQMQENLADFSKRFVDKQVKQMQHYSDSIADAGRKLKP